jgi:NADPH:quinone reductase-like Zn-dependent oxidoreductase
MHCRSGFEVITTCSPRNFSLVKSLGADHVFDYSSPTVGADINALTNDELLYAFDTISEGSSPAISTAALTSKPINGRKPSYGAILIVAPEKLGRPVKEVNHIFSLIYTIVGKKFRYITTEFEEKPEDTTFFVEFVPVLEKLVGEGKVKPQRLEVKGGWDDILSGLQEMKEGKVSGLKLVYRVG